LLVGGSQVRIILPAPRVATNELTALAAVGLTAGVSLTVANEPAPVEFTAETLKLYKLPATNPVTLDVVVSELFVNKLQTPEDATLYSTKYDNTAEEPIFAGVFQTSVTLLPVYIDAVAIKFKGADGKVSETVGTIETIGNITPVLLSTLKL
jgi:hypothetical protein